MYTSELSTTEVPTDAGSDLEPTTSGKRHKKQRESYSPPISPRKRHKATPGMHPDRKSVLDQLPPIPSELVAGRNASSDIPCSQEVEVAAVPPPATSVHDLSSSEDSHHRQSAAMHCSSSGNSTPVCARGRGTMSDAAHHRNSSVTNDGKFSVYRFI